MATCSANSRIRSATDPDSIVVAQTLVCVVDFLIQAYRVKSVLPFAQKKKWAKTHRTTHPRPEQALDYTGRIEWKQARVKCECRKLTVFRVPTLVGLVFGVVSVRKSPTKVGTLNTVELWLGVGSELFDQFLRSNPWADYGEFL